MSDAVIVGGGMQGATVALALSELGISATLVERDGISSGASGNSYGIIHGGLRYLQSLDIPRWRRSRQAQAWFLDRYGAMVRPLECVMPLYRGCLRSRAAFRLAQALDDGLTATLGPRVPLPRLRLIRAEETLRRFPVPAGGLTGAAIWHDATVDDAAQLIQAILADAGVAGERLRLGMQAERLIVEGGRVTGLAVIEGNGERHVIDTRQVIDCSGAGAPNLDRDAEARVAVLAFNLVLDLDWPERAALAVSERPGRGRSYFVRSDGARNAFVGTFYRPADAGGAQPHERDIAGALSILDHAVPGRGFARAAVKSVLAGLLPARDGAGMDLASDDRVTIDSPAGYVRIIGTKLTTAPILSERVAARIAKGMQ